MNIDQYEDWVYESYPKADFEARLLTLEARFRDCSEPLLDSFGVLTYRDRSISVSVTQRELLDEFIMRFGRVVSRVVLEYRLTTLKRHPTRNSLDLHILRLRRKIGPLGLIIDTVWGHGYVLDSVSAPVSDVRKPVSVS